MVSNENLIHKGRCLCGEIQFEMTGEPLWVAYCHCQTCRRNTGAPVTTFVGLSDRQFHYLKGTPTGYNSSPGVTRSFCATCGTPLTYEADRYPGEVHVYVSTFDDPSQFIPTAHVHVADEIPWFKLNDGLRRFTRSSND